MQGQDHVCCQMDRIQPLVGIGPVGALPADDGPETVHACRGRAGLHRDLADRHAGIDMQCQHRINTVHGTLLCHARRAAQPFLILDFFRWLEEKANRAGE